MWNLKYLAITFVIGTAFAPLLSGQQPPRRATSVPDLFNQEAAVSDPAGIHKYSEDLIGLIVPPGVSDETRKEVTDVLTDRLTRAEETARAGQGKFVAETDVIRAFNELMNKIGAPSSLRADEASMRNFREHAASTKAFPALLTADRNGTNCNPGEAVFLFYILLWSDGKPSVQGLDSAQEITQLSATQQGGKQTRGEESHSVASIVKLPTAQWLLSLYSSRHHRSTTIKRFNHIANTLGF